jgi:UDP-N-acetylglucosamine acyltransferase
MIGGVSGVREDIIPFGLAAGSFARLSGTQCRRNETKSVFRQSHPHRSVSISSDIFPQRLMAQHLDDAESKYGNNPSVAHIVAFIRNKGRQAICPPVPPKRVHDDRWTSSIFGSVAYRTCYAFCYGVHGEPSVA